MKHVILFLLAALLAMPAYAQDQVTGDPVVTQQDVADLRQRLFRLIDEFNGKWKSPSKIEAVMSVPLSKDADGWLSATGFRSLDYSQGFQPNHPGGALSTVYASYVGSFGLVPFGDQPDKCINVSDFRDRLLQKGWRAVEPTSGSDGETDYRFYRVANAVRLGTYGNDCVVEINLG